MADRAHSTSRRALLAGLSVTPAMAKPMAAFALSTAAGAGGVLAVTKALGAEPHPDAALLALEPGLHAIARHREELRAVSCRLEDEGHKSAGAAPDTHADFSPEWEARRDRVRAALKANGYHKADRAQRRVDDHLMKEMEAVTAASARTLDGLRMKARVAEYGADDDVAQSIVRDLLALDGRSEAATATA